MKATRSRAVELSIVLALLLGPAACGGSESASPTETPAAATETETPTATPTSTPTPEPTVSAADRQLERDKRFFTSMDDDAIALDTAIGLAIDSGTPGTAIARLRKRIGDRNFKFLERGGENFPGATALTSAAVSADEASQAGDVQRLAQLRTELAEARSQLAGEVLAP